MVEVCIGSAPQRIEFKTFVVFAFGSAEKGQLGNGKTGEHIVTGGKVVFDAEWEPSELLDDDVIELSFISLYSKFPLEV